MGLEGHLWTYETIADLVELCRTSVELWDFCGLTGILLGLRGLSGTSADLVEFCRTLWAWWDFCGLSGFLGPMRTYLDLCGFRGIFVTLLGEMRSCMTLEGGIWMLLE